MNLYNDFLDDWSEIWFQYIKDNLKYDPNDIFKYHWDYCCISRNVNLTWKTVEKYIDLEYQHGIYDSSSDPMWDPIPTNNCVWQYYGLSDNPNMTLEIAQNNPYNI